jgi:type I restriction enzyme S subunit
MTTIEQGRIKDLEIVFPPVPEQKEIAAFLDRETAKIDRLMTVRRKQVERLHEQRIAVISHAVTKGIDQNAKLKVSGVKWLDKIPIDWEVTPLWTQARLIVSNVDKKSVPGEQSVRLCNYLDVYKNDHINRGLAFMEATATRAEIAKFSLRLNDVIITKDSEDPNDIAVPAIVTESVPSLVCGYHLAILRALPRLLPAYLFHLFQTVYMRSYFATKAQGVTRFGLSQNDITRCPVPAPPVPAQEAIVRHIDREAVKLERLVTQYNKEIELLSEYRASLISHAVTGKIDVRGLVTTTHPKAA